MGRNRTPLEKAKLTGADRKNPQRFRDRSEPDSGGPLGNAPKYFTAEQRKAWDMFKIELEWLRSADRAIVELACITRAEIMAGGANVTAALLREHRQQLSSLGASPTSRSNVALPGEADEPDPFARFDS